MKQKFTHYILSFFFPIVLFLIMATLSDHVPFGKFLFNIYDSYTMYPSLLMHTIRSIKCGNIFYTLSSALGTDFYSVRSLYMNSPLNLLFLLFKEKHLFLFYTMLIYLRVGLSGLTMNLYLNFISKSKYKKKQILFSLLYALSSYAIANSVHIMWMDCFVLLPLIIMGLTKLINGEFSKLYICFLSLCIIINFYIGYMVCLFCLLYFIYKCFLLKKWSFPLTKKFFISSFLCGMIGSIVIFPAFYSLLQGRATNFSMSALFGISTFSLSSLIYNLFPASYVTFDNFNDGSPLLYCSLFVVLFHVLYYINPKITKREKVVSFLFVLFFFFSFFINFIDFSWNLFQEPIWWSHRYSFVFTFLCIDIAFQSFEKRQYVEISTKKKLLLFVVTTLLLFLSFSYKMMGLLLSDFYVLYLYIGLFFFFIYLYFWKNKKMKFILFFLVLLEITLNGYQILTVNKSVSVQSANAYLDKKESVNNLKQYDRSFYRMILNDQNENDPMLFDYPSVSLFSSMYNDKVHDFYYSKMGVDAKGVNHITMEFKNPAILPLLSVKYLYGTSRYYPAVKDDIHFIAPSLSIGYVVPDAVKNLSLDDSNPYENIEKLYSTLCKDDIHLFYKEDYQIELSNLERSENGSIIKKDFLLPSYQVFYNFTASHDGIVVPRNAKYFKYIKITIYREDETIMYPPTSIDDNLFEIKENDQVEILYDLAEAITEEYVEEDFEVRILDTEKLKEALEVLNTYPSLYDINTQNHILEGKIDVKENSLFFLSIPYQKGFSIYVDGKKVDYFALLDTFIGIELSSGNHEIAIDYETPYVRLGLLFSILGILGSLFYFFFEKRNTFYDMIETGDANEKNN